MEFGFFDEKNKEYVIENPKTPTPWINYLGSEEYCALISNNAGGYSFYRSAKTGRFTRFRYNNLPMDRPGRYIYLHNKASGDYWTASWQPVGKPLDKYKTETRHGLGYTKIKSVYDFIQSEVCYFVPLAEKLEIWWIKIKNLNTKPVEISVFTYTEFAVWQAIADLTDYQYFLNVVRTSLHPESKIIDFDVGTFVTIGRPRAFGLITLDPSGFDCDRESFIGAYRSEANPLAVEKGCCFNSIAIGGNACASFQTDLKLEAAEEKSFAVIIGIGEASQEGLKAKAKYSQVDNIEKEFNNLKENWTSKLAFFNCQTEDLIFNQTINVLNPYQAHTTFNWSRSASYYESGTFRDGLGFRDSNQDALSIIPAEPQKVKDRLLSLACAISTKGHAAHTFQPLTGEAYGGTDYSDDHLWTILTAAAYIRETGDKEVLFAEIPWLDSPRKASLLEHLKCALDYSLKMRGSHGLCLNLKADWDDTLNLTAGGESVWTTELLIKALSDFQELALHTGFKTLARKYDKAKESLIRAIQIYAWEGDWFIRAYTGSGSKVGSKHNCEGQIFLNPNTWAIISQAATREQGLRAMDSVRALLKCDFGLMALFPAYRSYDPELGAISLYPPSLKENGAVFVHTNPWAVIAECMLGRGDYAFEYFKLICPLSMNDKADLRKTEPYVFCQFLAGKEHIKPGEGRNSWLTGSASWSYVCATQYILGIRPEIDGLRVDPCIPASWDGFKVKRVFRGKLYEITINNKAHVGKGIKHLKVNGNLIEGNLIEPNIEDSSALQVEAEMG